MKPQLDIIISVPSNTLRCEALKIVLSHHAANGFDRTDLQTAVKSVRRAVTVAASTIIPAEQERSHVGSGDRLLGRATLIITEDGMPIGHAHINGDNTVTVSGEVAKVWNGLKAAQDLRWNREEWGPHR